MSVDRLDCMTVRALRCRIRHHGGMRSSSSTPDVPRLIQVARKRAGLTQRQLADVAGTSQAAVARYERGVVVPDVRTLARLVEGCGFRLVLDMSEPSGRTGRESAVRRPPAIPDDLDDPSIEKASGVVELPLHVQWSGRRRYDLSDPADRARVYELVLREGDEDDVRRFVRVDALVELWDDLMLPTHVRDGWQQWLDAHRIPQC